MLAEESFETRQNNEFEALQVNNLDLLLFWKTPWKMQFTLVVKNE